MPHIVVWNLKSIRATRAVKAVIPTAVASVLELGISAEKVVVSCTLDADFNKEDPVIVRIGLLYDQPEVNAAALQKLAWRVGDAVKEVVPNQKVFVAIEPRIEEGLSFIVEPPDYVPLSTQAAVAQQLKPQRK